MKRIFFILLIVFLGFSVKASHLMGGEITWECIKDPTSPNVGQYIFTMKVYRDCDGITVSTVAQTLTVWGHPSVTGITVDFVTQTDVSPQCDPINSGNTMFSCANGDLGAVEEYIFQSQPISLPGMPTAAGWHFSWSSCCRNTAIVNLLNSSEGFTLRASMYPYFDPTTGNQIPAEPCFDSSPNFKEQPKTILCTGFPFSYSHNASDEELDSLVYSWGDPLDDDVFSGPIFNPGVTPSILAFAPPYSTISPLPGAPTLDASTGEISYNATTAGFFVTCIKIEAFKCGQLVAEIFREVQVVLVDCSTYPSQPVSGINSPPSISAPFIDPVTGLPSFETTVYAGDLVTFSIQGDDADVYTNGTPQDLTLEVSGGQFSDNFLPSGNCLNPPCATFDNGLGLTPPFSAPALVSGEFRWQTSCNHIAAIAGCGATSNVFTFLIKIHDDFCPAFGITIATIKVTVVPAPIDQSPDIRCVSVNSNGDVDITWEFLGSEQASTVYEIFHSSNLAGPYTLLDSVTYPTNTYTHIGSGADVTSQYYYLRSHSECASDSDPSDTLQTIDLDVTAINGGTQGDLNWNPIHTPDLTTSSNYYHIHALTGGVWTLVDSSTTTSGIFDARTCNSLQSLMISLDDQSGCVSNSSIDGAVLVDTISPSSPVISDVSVDITGKAVISWTSSSPDVDIFAIYWKDPQGAWITIDSVAGNISSYIFNNSNAQQTSESYRIRALDSCGNQSSTSLIHNSINLISSIDICSYTLNFTWNDYVNFTGGIGHYKVFLIEEDVGGNITNNITQRFNPSDMNFTFSNIQQNYTYYVYVEAYNSDSSLIARSDQEVVTIDLPTKPKYNYIEYVSVIHDSNDFGYVDISCLIDNQAMIDYYLVLRSLKDSANFSQIATIPFPDNNQDKITYIDRTVQTDNYVYEYRIYPVDTCGAISITGSFYDPITGSSNDTSFGRTMLVQIASNMDYGESFPDTINYTDPNEWSHLGEGKISNQFTNTISFNEYEKFNAVENVSEYRLYRSISSDNSFNMITPIHVFNRIDNPEEPLIYIDVVTSFGNTNGYFCYYIEAVEGPTTVYVPANGVVSNIGCVYQDPKLFIPNSFTPDGSGPLENEIFIPVKNFVSDVGYSFVIYDRSGNELFKTTDPKKGWDGNYLGNPVPNGTYIYHIQYINGFGSLTDNTGSVLIIR